MTVGLVDAPVAWTGRRCSFTECPRPSHARDLCIAHYKQQRAGRPLSLLPPMEIKLCSFDDCTRPRRVYDLCDSHNWTERRKGTPSQMWNGQGRPYNRNQRRLLRFGITPERYDEMLEEQDGVCAICKRPETRVSAHTGEIQPLAIDHDHACCPARKSCGRCVRRLLCGDCNNGLGQFRDNPDRLIAAAQYLVEHQDVLVPLLVEEAAHA
jgi:hypothetical protein